MSLLSLVSSPFPYLEVGLNDIQSEDVVGEVPQVTLTHRAQGTEIGQGDDAEEFDKNLWNPDHLLELGLDTLFVTRGEGDIVYLHDQFTLTVALDLPLDVDIPAVMGEVEILPNSVSSPR